METVNTQAQTIRVGFLKYSFEILALQVFHFILLLQSNQKYAIVVFLTRTCDGLGVPAVGRRRRVWVKLAALALAHILLLLGALLVGLGVRVRVQVWGRGQGGGRGGQLGSPLTAGEKQGPWASGAGAPPGQQVRLADRRQ